jgi:ribosomal protein S21
MKKQRAKKHEMIVIGKPNNVKVSNGDINSAIKLWKRQSKEAGTLEILKSKLEYVKPSVKKRKQIEDARYSQLIESKRNKENNG